MMPFVQILLALGLLVLAGCASTQSQTSPQSNCPPPIPALPGVDADGMVSLGPNDQAALLFYFLQVERCGQP